MVIYMKISVKAIRKKVIDEFTDTVIVEFVVESSEHRSPRACLNELYDVVKAISPETSYAIEDVLTDLRPKR